MKRYEFLNLAATNAPYMEEIRAAVDRVITSGRYVGGEENERFEKKLALMHGARFAVGVSNGLDAMRLILEAYKLLGKLSAGDDIIVPANTYVATIMAIIQAGLNPVMVEPSLETLNINTSAIERAITPRTRAIMTVHLYGRVAYDAEMARIVKNHNLLLLEDNAQAIGAVSSTLGLFFSNRSGALGDAGAFSFYPTKNIGAIGDAGAVVTPHAELADAVRALSNYGSDRRYHNIYSGFNCRLDPIQAAVLNVKLDHLEQESNRRRELAAVYNAEITHPAITLPSIPADPREHVWHQYVILSPERDRLRQYLADNGVQTDIHYATPPHRQPCYSSRFSGLRFPVTDLIADRALSLPISILTSPDDAREIAAIINRCNP
ncbi:MAG: DegT/DnrJ/EryC1/StrS family aminotransferase [Muribaculaceae bacterium]|nr:DegT/DnrJ/EryC1/StrS family aminotransferase [Muribaculaceae bacterium]